jgi:U3 small nucleolar RNA-associated protein 25
MEGLAKKRYEQAQLHILQVTDLVEPAPTIQKHLTEMLSATAPTFRHASADALMRRGLVLARALATKADVFHGCMETVDEEQLYVQMLAAYVCSHIIRAQAVVEAHNLGLAQRTNVSITDNDWDQYRDRGLNRARVLILAPTRHVAYAFMHALVACLRPRQLGNIQRFEDEFGPSASDGTVSEDPTTLLVPPFEPVPEKEADTPRAQHWRSKPRDYRAAMKGNIDDDFRLGVRMARRSIHFFADFMDSDVIVASPLGLQRVLDDPEKGGPKGGAADPFSSIEIAIVLRAHVILMQNWDHALQLFQEAVNSMPVHLPTKTDFSRVEQRFLDGNAAAYRQDIILSAFDVPQMHAWFRLARRQGVENVSGVLKILRTWHPGVLSDVRSTLSTAKRSASSARVRHLFQRIALPSSQIVRPSKERASTCPGIQTEEHRFEEFAKRWLPKVVKSSQTHILIYVPSYFDFVRVRNLFRQWLERRIFPVSEIRYAACSEYTKPQDVSRNRLAFYEGRVRFLIITERFHFYHRYRLRGVRNVYFYSVPQCASFYAEIVERLESAGSSFRQSNTLFALPNDAIALHRIIGSRNFRYIASNPLRLEFAFFAERGTRL